MIRQFRIDLRKIEGDGEFHCPTCGSTLSPDDYSGLTYSILAVRNDVEGGVQSATIQCSLCESLIYLEGFDSLSLIQSWIFTFFAEDGFGSRVCRVFLSTYFQEASRRSLYSFRGL